MEINFFLFDFPFADSYRSLLIILADVLSMLPNKNELHFHFLWFDIFIRITLVCLCPLFFHIQFCDFYMDFSLIKLISSVLCWNNQRCTTITKSIQFYLIFLFSDKTPAQTIAFFCEIKTTIELLCLSFKFAIRNKVALFLNLLFTRKLVSLLLLFCLTMMLFSRHALYFTCCINNGWCFLRSQM